MERNATQKIKIAQVIGNAKTGGVVNCVLNFWRHVDKTRFQFDFFTYGPSPFDDEIRALGGNVFFIPSVLNYFKAKKVMEKLFAEGGYDAVHAHLTSLAFVPLSAAKKAGVKTRICHAHSTCNIHEKVWIVKNTLKHFSKIYATHLAGCSRYACNWLYGKKRGKEAFVLHNAIDLDRFVRNDEKAALLKKQAGFEDKKIVGHVGRMEFQKNPLFLIDLFAQVAKLCDDAVLVMVGDGSLMPKVKKRVEKHGLQDRVFVMPEKKAVEEYYALFDVFVLPSRFEGLPLVAVEAQAMGIPCLLSDKITKETDVTGRCEFLPLKKEVWARKTADALASGKRHDGSGVAQAGYDIMSCVKELEEFYLNAVDLK